NRKLVRHIIALSILNYWRTCLPYLICAGICTGSAERYSFYCVVITTNRYSFIVKPLRCLYAGNFLFCSIIGYCFTIWIDIQNKLLISRTISHSKCSFHKGKVIVTLLCVSFQSSFRCIFINNVLAFAHVNNAICRIYIVVKALRTNKTIAGNCVWFILTGRVQGIHWSTIVYI